MTPDQKPGRATSLPRLFRCRHAIPILDYKKKKRAPAILSTSGHEAKLCNFVSRWWDKLNTLLLHGACLLRLSVRCNGTRSLRCSLLHQRHSRTTGQTWASGLQGHENQAINNRWGQKMSQVRHGEGVVDIQKSVRVPCVCCVDKGVEDMQFTRLGIF